METGQIFNNRYYIKARIDEGNIAETYLAYDKFEQMEVVLKILFLRKAKEWKYIELFERETEVLKGLKHDNIPDFLESFTIDYDDDRCFVTVQEYIKGENINQLINNGKRFDEDEIIKTTKQILKVLEYFQKQKPPIIHRDINPKNIIITADGKTYLIDLGSVQNYIITNTEDSSTVVGTFGYMSPEQSIGKATPASDLYSLGMTIIYMITGKQPGLMEQVDLKPQYHNTALSSKELQLLIELLIEPDESKRIKTAHDALSILSEAEKIGSFSNYNSDVVSKIYKNQLPDDTKIDVSVTQEFIVISLPKRFGINLQGSFGKTIILLSKNYIRIIRSLGRIWKKDYKIKLIDVVRCKIIHRDKEKEKFYLSIETIYKDINFAHNLKNKDKFSIKTIINNFIEANKPKEKKPNDENIGTKMIKKAFNKFKNFVNKLFDDV